MKFDILTIFPDIFSGFLNESLIAKAQKKRLISIQTHYLRDWTSDRHQTVDGKPYGGGPGLVMKAEPIRNAIRDITKGKKAATRIVLFSPRGKQMNQAMVKRWAKLDRLVFICGRYEGVDERVADYIADEVVSVGPYVLNGGEVAAMAGIEAVARLIPGFMHTSGSQTKFDHAQYTKPEVALIGGKKRRVPKVLLSGNHKEIEAWREQHR